MDVVHIAAAVVYELDYVVTWNCKHIANGHILRSLLKANTDLGLFTPLLYTPAELVELPMEEGESQ